MRKVLFKRCELMKLKISLFSLDLTKELAELEKSGSLTLVNLANAAAKSFLIAQILKKTQFRNVLWASIDERADAIASAAEFFFDGDIQVIPKDISPRRFYELRATLASERPTLLLLDRKSVV